MEETIRETIWDNHPQAPGVLTQIKGTRLPVATQQSGCRTGQGNIKPLPPDQSNGLGQATHRQIRFLTFLIWVLNTNIQWLKLSKNLKVTD